MKKLTIGDKVRIKRTNEAAEIITIISDVQAIVETFDGEMTISCRDIIPFITSDSQQKWSDGEEIEFVQSTKSSTQKVKKDFSLNERKNQFNYELDLHAPSLISRFEEKSDEEILTIQVHRAKEYILNAIELRMQRVYIIHGVGSGRLKSEIHHLLHQMNEVKGYTNNYSERFGMGATEVKLR